MRLTDWWRVQAMSVLKGVRWRRVVLRLLDCACMTVALWMWQGTDNWQWFGLYVATTLSSYALGADVSDESHEAWAERIRLQAQAEAWSEAIEVVRKTRAEDEVMRRAEMLNRVTAPVPRH